jgi:CheY-like chemotaxis protein
MKKKILITDDTEDILLNLQEYLMMEGYAVTVATNGCEALASLKMNLPDLIITDLLMPVMTGFELIKEIKKQESLRDIPVLVFSAMPKDGGSEFAELAADRVVMKPSPPDVLLGHVVELLARRQ